MENKVQKAPKPKDYRPDKLFLNGHRFQDSRRCKAWNGNRGKQCGKLAMNDREVCRSHGGATPRGQLSPHFKTGDFSKYAPKNISSGHSKLLKKTEWITLEKELGLARAILELQLKRVEEIKLQIEDSSVKTEIENIQLVTSVQKQIGEIRKLALAQRQLLVDQQEYITREWALTIFGKLMKTIRENVLHLEGGEKAIKNIANEIGRYS
jgi:hypothetical protein